MKIVSYILLILLLSSLNQAFGQKDHSKSLEENLHNYLNVIHQKQKFSGEILVAKGNEILFNQAIGLVSREHNIPLKTGASYRIASIAKTFTGTLIAMAETENLLSPNDKAIQHLESLSETFKDITIHQLLTHRSGIPHNEGIKDYWQVKSKLSLTNNQIIDELNQLEMLFEPGSQMKYSSLGYVLLAMILENVYQDSYENILQSKILNPLNMNETGSVNTLKIIPRMASGYHIIGDDSIVKAPYRNYSMLKGAGDIYTTSRDLLAWNRSFFENHLLSKKAKRKIFEKKDDSSYGYGWYLAENEPVKYYHGGGTWGYSSYSTIYPKEKITIIILSNLSSLPMESLALDVENIVFEKSFSMPVVEKSIELEKGVEMYAGDFLSDSGKGKLKIVAKENRLFAQLMNNPPFEIYPKGDHKFFGKKIEIQLAFELENGEIKGLTAKRMGQTFHFNKL